MMPRPPGSHAPPPHFRASSRLWHAPLLASIRLSVRLCVLLAVVLPSHAHAQTLAPTRISSALEPSAELTRNPSSSVELPVVLLRLEPVREALATDQLVLAQQTLAQLCETQDPGLLTREALSQVQQLKRHLQALSEARSPQAKVLPRKRSLNPDGSLRPAQEDPAQARAQLEQQLQVWIQLLYLLADEGAQRQQLSTVFEATAGVLRVTPAHYLGWTSRQQALFLDASAFMLTTARRSDEVLELYEQVGIPLEPLAKKTQGQLERWLNLYQQAPEQVTQVGGTRQTLTDMLSLLAEDAALARLMPERERIRLLQRLAEVALARQQYGEAIGALSRLQDKKRLKSVGQQLSKQVLVETESALVVQREVALAIEALLEAEDRAGLQTLHERCEAAEARVLASTRPVINRDSLTGYLRLLKHVVAGGHPDPQLLAELRARPAGSSVPQAQGEPLETLSAERLHELSLFYAQQLHTSLGPERVAAEQVMKALADEAQRRGLHTLALQVHLARSAAGTDAGLALVGLGDVFQKQGDWRQALMAYQGAGGQGVGGLRALGDRLTRDRSLMVQGDFNPLVEVACEAYLAADAVDRLEPLYANLVGTRQALERLGTASTEGLLALERCLRSIETAYELQRTLTVEIPKQAAPPTSPKKSPPKRR